MRVYDRRKSGHCNCVHHVRAFRENKKGEIVGFQWSCELDEYDERIGCKKGQCHYYRKERKTK